MMKGVGTSWFLAGIALALYVVGGGLIMGGLVLIGMMGGQSLWELGEARGLGYLAFAVGIVLSISGVLLMRIMRNRG